MMGMMQPPMYLGIFLYQIHFFTYFFVWANTGLTVQWLCKVAAVLLKKPRMCKGGPGPLAAPGNMKARARVLPSAGNYPIDWDHKKQSNQKHISTCTGYHHENQGLKYYFYYWHIVSSMRRNANVPTPGALATETVPELTTPRAACLVWARPQCLQCQGGSDTTDGLLVSTMIEEKSVLCHPSCFCCTWKYPVCFPHWDSAAACRSNESNDGYATQHANARSLGIHSSQASTETVKGWMLRVGFFCDFCSKACNDEAATNEPTAGHATCHEIVRTLWGEKGLVWLMAMSAAILPKGASHEPGECTVAGQNMFIHCFLWEEFWTQK